jgi:hypothetical protein
MALSPTGSNPLGETRSELIRRITHPNANKTPRPKSQDLVGSNKQVGLSASVPQAGYRIRAATTDEEINAQLKRLFVLIANDNIDQGAPRGSYLNVLL